MPEGFVTLNCENCGAKLNVYDDADRLACGYCGTQMIVQRRGGTVGLKLVQAAIQKVQIGTDKTAAELAIARWEGELRGLRQREAAAKGKQSGERWEVGCGVVLFLVAGAVIGGWGGGLMVVFALVGLGVLLLRLLGILSPQSSPADKELRAIQAQIRELEGRIREKKRIADA